MLLALASGIGILLYIILMIVMPSEANVDGANMNQAGSTMVDDVSSGLKDVRRHPQGPAIAAGLLIALGFYLLLNNLGWLGWLRGELLLSVALIGAGIYFLTRKSR